MYRYQRSLPFGFTVSALLIAATLTTIFTIVAMLVLTPVRENIHFVEKELAGIHEHRILMSQFIHSRLTMKEKKNLHRRLEAIGNESNLILDPKLSSYYLVNIAVQNIPDMLLTTDSYLIQHISEEIHYSLEQVQQAGVDTQSIKEALTSLKHDTTHIEALYTATATQLEYELNLRLEKETARFRQQIAVMIAMFIVLILLAFIAIRYYINSKMFHVAEEKLHLLEKLEKSNADLEHFSYFTAHDLKEPIRTIACFAALMEESPAHAQHLPTIRKAALRMETLINDVLSFLSTGEKASLEWVDVNAVLKEVQDDLHVIINSSGATFSVEPLPEIHTSRLALSRVLQNIIANAIHYRKLDAAPHIHIAASKQGNDWVFRVSDNGMGFDMGYAKQVFEPFKRLHNSSAKSSGIGLSICKKLLSDIGGDIWIESTPDVGTRVFFRLPAA